MENIYAQHAKLVYGFLLSKCKDANLAEELTQETFLQAIKSFDSYNGTCKISVWLCQIAKHLLYQHWSKHRDTVSLSSLEWEIPDTVNLEQLVIDRIELEEIKIRINELPENMRKVLFFRVAQNMSFREIGEIMEKSENWARVTFFRAKELLKDRRMEYE